MKRIASLLIACLIFLISCSNNLDDINDLSGISTSQFAIGMIHVEKIQTIDQDSLWADIIGRVEVTFRTCLKDKGLLIPIPGGPFYIKNGDSSKDTVSDVNGCILFQRVIEYPKAVSKQIFFKFTTSIISKGRYRGHADLPLAYNPWGQQVKDLRPGKETIDPAFIIVELDNLQHHETLIKPLLTPVIVHNMQLIKNTYKRTQEESEFVYDLYLRPQFKKMGIHSPVNTPLTSGEFIGDFFWIQRDEQSGEITHTFGESSLEGKIDESGNLIFRGLPLRFKGRNLNVPFELGLTLTPKGGGIYALLPNHMSGKVSNLSRPANINLEQGEKSEQLLSEFSIKKNIAEYFDSDTLPRHPFIVTEITARIVPYPGDNIYQLRKLYSFNACITNPDFLIPTPVFDKDFTITSGGVEFSKTSHTRLGGCLVWEHIIEYSRTDYSKRLILPITITGSEEFSGIFKTNIFFNPWDEQRVFDQRMLFEEDMEDTIAANLYFSKKTLEQITKEQQNKILSTKLLVERINMRYLGSNRNSDEAIFRYDIAIGKPRIQRQGIQNPLVENLYHGPFRADFFLVERSTETGKITHAFGHSSLEGLIDENRELLFFNVKLKMGKLRNKSRELDLIVDVTPIATKEHPLPDNFIPSSGYIRLTNILMTTTSPLFHHTKTKELSERYHDFLKNNQDGIDVPDIISDTPPLYPDYTPPFWPEDPELYGSPPPNPPQKEEKYPNSFYVEKITMSKKAEDDLTFHTWINILGKKHFIFRACITDEARKDRFRIREQPFRITSGKDVFYEETNPEGCLYWQQTFEYLELAEMEYFQLKVKIEGLEEYKGIRYIPLGVRPWNNDLRDYRFEPGIQNAKNDIVDARKKGIIQDTRLIVVNATFDNLTEERRPDYSRYNYRLRINPQFQTRTGKGLQQFPFTNGRFRVHTIMVERDRETLEIIKSFGTASQVAEITNAELIFNNLWFVTCSQRDENNRLDVGIVLEPDTYVAGTPSTAYLPLPEQGEQDETLSDIRKSLPRTFGFRELGTFTDPNTTTYTPVPNENDAFHMLVKKEHEAICDSSTDRDLEVEYLKAVEGNYIGSREGVNGMYVTKRFRYEACLRDADSHGRFQGDIRLSIAVKDQEGNILNPGGKPQYRTLRKTLCTENLEFDIKFHEWAAQSFKNLVLEIKGQDGIFKNVDIKRTFCVNPWIYEKETIFYDPNQGQAETPCNRVNTVKSALWVDNVEVNFHELTSRRPYDLKENLDLVINKRYRFFFDLRIQFYDTARHFLNYTPVYVSGSYRLIAMILSPKYEIYNEDIFLLDDYNVISVGEEKFVNVQNARVNEELQLPINLHNIPMMALKNKILIYLAPAVPDPHILPLVIAFPIWGPFQMINLRQEIYNDWTHWANGLAEEIMRAKHDYQTPVAFDFFDNGRRFYFDYMRKFEERILEIAEKFSPLHVENTPEENFESFVTRIKEETEESNKNFPDMAFKSPRSTQDTSVSSFNQKLKNNIDFLGQHNELYSKNDTLDLERFLKTHHDQNEEDSFILNEDLDILINTRNSPDQVGKETLRKFCEYFFDFKTIIAYNFSDIATVNIPISSRFDEERGYIPIMEEVTARENNYYWHALVECLNNPRKYIMWQPIDHVMKITNAPHIPAAATEVGFSDTKTVIFNEGSNYTQSVNDGERAGSGVDYAAGFSGGFDLANFVPWLLGKGKMAGNTVSRVRNNKVTNVNPNGRGPVSFGGLFSLNAFLNASNTLYSYKAEKQRTYGINKTFGESTGQGTSETLQLAKREVVFKFDASVKQCLLIKLRPHTSPAGYRGTLMGVSYPVEFDKERYENFQRRFVVKRFEKKKLNEYDRKTFETYKKAMEYEIIYRDLVEKAKEVFGQSVEGQQRFVEFKERIGSDLLIRNDSAAYLCLPGQKEKKDIEERYYTVNHIFLAGNSSMTHSQRFAHPYTTAMRGVQNWEEFERFIRENDVFYIVREKALQDKYYHRDEKTNDLQKYYEAELVSDNAQARDILQRSFPHAVKDFSVDPKLQINFINKEESTRLSHPGVVIDNFSHGLLRKEFEIVQEFERDLREIMQEQERTKQNRKCNILSGPLIDLSALDERCSPE